MSTSILILSQPDDLHAYAVQTALEAKGQSPVLWHTSDFPMNAGESMRFAASEGRVSTSIRLRGPDFDLQDPHFDVVWNRRPTHYLDPLTLHPADRDFAEWSVRTSRQGLMQLLEASAFWVNPQSAVRHGNKILQSYHASRVGLEVPETLYSNDPDEIRAFLRDQGGSAVYKPLKGLPWKDDETYWMPYTSRVTEDDLVSDELLRAAPGIYQALVPKAYEIRLTLMGRRPFAFKVCSQQTRTGRLDWRKSYHELHMEPIELPTAVVDACSRLLDHLGLVFGCFDLIVTPDGRHLFLEVNQMGQFLFLEHATGYPLLDAFTDFLIQGRSAAQGDFDWNESRSSLRYADLRPRALKRLEAARQTHRVPPEGTFVEASEDAPAA